MEQSVVIELIDPDQWERLRSIRLKSLRENPEAFGGNFESESAENETEWR